MQLPFPAATPESFIQHRKSKTMAAISGLLHLRQAVRIFERGHSKGHCWQGERRALPALDWGTSGRPGPDPHPAVAVQQALHPVRGGIPNLLGQLPAVLPFHLAQQSSQIIQCPPSWLRPPEPAGDALMHPPDALGPPPPLRPHTQPQPYLINTQLQQFYPLWICDCSISPNPPNGVGRALEQDITGMERRPSRRIWDGRGQ